VKLCFAIAVVVSAMALATTASASGIISGGTLVYSCPPGSNIGENVSALDPNVYPNGGWIGADFNGDNVSCNNVGEASFFDNTGGQLDVPGDMTVAATDASGADVSWTVNAVWYHGVVYPAVITCGTEAQDNGTWSITPTHHYPVGTSTVTCDSPVSLQPRSFTITVSPFTPIAVGDCAAAFSLTYGPSTVDKNGDGYFCSHTTGSGKKDVLTDNSHKKA
jgi:hypothetical protein